MWGKDKKESMICFAVDSQTKDLLEEYLYNKRKWESISEFMRWLLKEYLKKALAQEY